MFYMAPGLICPSNLPVVFRFLILPVVALCFHLTHRRLFFLFLGVAGGAIERSRYYPHYVKPRETMRKSTRQLCLRAAQQQKGASPVTAVAIRAVDGN